MGNFFLLLIILSPSIGQILPTVPRNVFRLTLEDYSADSEWDLKDQEFDLRGIGKAYYDHTTKNDTGYFSASHDLYHMGDQSIDSVHTVESYLNEFNEAYGTDLPVFGINGYGDFDTTKQIMVSGIFSESRRRKESGRRYRIDYGMSDQVTLTLKVPIVNSLKEKYNVSATADPIDGINDLIIYHETSKAHIDSFFRQVLILVYRQADETRFNRYMMIIIVLMGIILFYGLSIPRMIHWAMDLSIRDFFLKRSVRIQLAFQILRIIIFHWREMDLGSMISRLV